MKKEMKYVSRLIFLGIVFTLFSTVVYADVGDLFIKGLTDISNFFEDSRYRNYSLAIDFFLFTAGFTALFLIGLQTAFGLRKDGQTEWKSTITKPIQALAIVLGLLAALLLIRAGYSTADLLPYLHWFLCALILVLLFKFFERLGLKSILINLVVSLVLAMIICTFLTGLVHGPGDTFWDRFTGIDIPSPGISSPGSFPGSSTLPSGRPGIGADKILGDDGGMGNLWWIIPLLLLLAGGGAFGLRKLGRWRKKKKANQPVETEGAATDDSKGDSIEGIRNIFEDTVKAKKKVDARLSAIVDKKKKEVSVLVDRYHKALSVDPAYYQDPGHPVNKKLSEESKIVADLIKEELKLEKDLQKLNELEQKLLANGVNWTVKIVKRHWKDPEVHKQALELKKANAKTPIGFYEKLLHILERSKDKFTQKDLPPQYIYYREKSISLIRMLLSDEYTIHKGYPSGKATQIGTVKDFLTDSMQDRIVNEGYCRSVIRQVGHYFLIGEDNKKREKQWKKITRPGVLKEFVTNKDKWKRIESSTPEAIKAHFEEEERFFHNKESGFKVTLERQIKAMNYLIGCLKILEKLREPIKKQKTEMQPLMITYTYKDKEGEEKVKELSSKELERKPFIPLGARIEVHTLLKRGEGPRFKLQCLLNGSPLLREPFVIEKKEKHPKISVMISDHIALAKGQHSILFDLKGSVETDEAALKKWNRDQKIITIRIGEEEHFSEEGGPGSGGSPTVKKDGLSPIKVCNPQKNRELTDEEIKKVYEVDLQTVMVEWLNYVGKNKARNSFLQTFNKVEYSLKRCYNGSIPGFQSYDSEEVRSIIGEKYWKAMSQYYQRAISFRKYLLKNYDTIAERLITQVLKTKLDVPEEALKKLRSGKLKEGTLTSLVRAAFEKDSKSLEDKKGMLYYLWMLLYRGTYFYMGARDYMRIARNVVNSRLGEETQEADILKYQEWMKEGLPKQFDPSKRMQPPKIDPEMFKKAESEPLQRERTRSEESIVTNQESGEEGRPSTIEFENKENDMKVAFKDLLNKKRINDDKVQAFTKKRKGSFLTSHLKETKSLIEGKFLFIPYPEKDRVKDKVEDNAGWALPTFSAIQIMQNKETEEDQRRKIVKIMEKAYDVTKRERRAKDDVSISVPAYGIFKDGVFKIIDKGMMAY